MLDPRGPRFAAALTTAVVVLVLVTGSGWLALAQAAVFAAGAVQPRYGPYSLIFKYLVRPLLSPPGELEDPAPVRFSQAVGLAFMLIAAAGYLGGASVLGVVAAGFALLAAFLNAAFGLCLGCEAYLLLRHLRTTRTG
jgi:hypothetical protein